MFGIHLAWQPAVITAILSLFTGIIIEKYRNRRPILEYYLSSMSSFFIPAKIQGQIDINLYTHSIVIHNRGRASANNVKVVHRINKATSQNFWFRISPDVQFSEDVTPEGNLIISIDKLLPNAWVTVSYLYMYPHRADFIHNYVVSDEVHGIPISVLFVRQTPKWLQWLFLVLSLLGLAYVIQLFIILV